MDIKKISTMTFYLDWADIEADSSSDEETILELDN